jgi:hypothetical protein
MNSECLAFVKLARAALANSAVTAVFKRRQLIAGYRRTDGKTLGLY